MEIELAPPTFQALVLTFLLEKHIKAIWQVITCHIRVLVHYRALSRSWGPGASRRGFVKIKVVDLKGTGAEGTISSALRSFIFPSQSGVL